VFRILIVDDTKSIHTFVKELLKKRADLQFADAYNGQEAVEVINKSANEFDLVLLDWEMPIMTGPEALQAIKESGCNIPVIMMTTRNAPDEIAKLLEMGASEYLMKPFTADILLEKIEYACGEAFQRAG
jgi:two-component system chemotaxis response regulator CheY